MFAVRGSNLKKRKKTAEEVKVGRKRVTGKRSGLSALPVANGGVTSEPPQAVAIKDIPQLRASIHDLIVRAAETIAIQVIEDAKSGQLPAVKYLFEFAGLHPATEEAKERPIETTLAQTLLTRMGLPIEPWAEDEEGMLREAVGESGEVGAKDTVK